MPPRRKRVSKEEENEKDSGINHDNNAGGNADATESAASPSVVKYPPGKHPKIEEDTPTVDYETPLDPRSELFTEEWKIPRFNLFINFILDELIEKYKLLFKDFIKLPSRKFHPQYYYKIQQPISINEIKSRDYEFNNGPRTFLLDVELLTKNCRAYNETDTLIVKNSMQIVNYIKCEILRAKNITKNYLISDPIRVKLLNYLDKVYKVTDKGVEMELGNKISNLDDKLHISEPFQELVSKEDLPEYYEIIQKPLALDTIKNNLEYGIYTKIYDFLIDMQLLFQNALVFNSSDSLIYQDASKLLNYFNHLIDKKFFAELIDASERGELKLEYDKVEFEQYLANGGNTKPLAGPLLPDDDHDFDFDNIEGLGNGYNRSLLTEDYLLSGNVIPSTTTNVDALVANVDTNEVKRRKLSPELEDESLKIMKYNIVKAVTKDSAVSQYLLDKKQFTFIRQVSIFSSKHLYNVATKPMSGSRPSCNQNWVEYKFIGKELNQNENAFSFSLEPIQSFLTLESTLNENNNTSFETVLIMNNEIVKSDKQAIMQKRQQQQNQINHDTHNKENSIDLSKDQNESLLGPEKFELRLHEGLNQLEFRCTDKISGQIEKIKFWISIYP
ncbi:hypothetical protein TBLA_0I00590 [Henningerozyma blattae CBS 6284]|uniref:Bromo domain-containing protein n=1 Tax=Henningerozyma blattae (strain ATCC 34711 / CBS 6284 / DSM 70876 / NBRC 10599 / NRRL Y-10934 / UCD 77-7) TaxID=1071380 RepID=I2H8L7_HENB6|nr:hypothetical protein TBLA_0I00590 [Tetrapisispora blattae CBS 6284]CCH62719.1 hypothetical protein TBLA_0I00590 [Tetrapisispora blattae CBS 6284]